MALEYLLVVAGSASRRRLITRLGFTRDRFDRSGHAWRGRFDALGMDVALHGGRSGRWDCGAWLFQADRYLQVTFRLDDAAAVGRLAPLVDRALAGGEEDMGLIALGSVLVLERRRGRVRRHEATWPGLPPERRAGTPGSAELVRRLEGRINPVLAVHVLGLPDEPAAVEALAGGLVQDAVPLTRLEAEGIVALGASVGADPGRVAPARALSTRAERIVFDAFVIRYGMNTVDFLDERVLAHADGTALDWIGDRGPAAARAAARELLEIATVPGHPLRGPLEDEANQAWFSGALAPLGRTLAERIADRVEARLT